MDVLIAVLVTVIFTLLGLLFSAAELGGGFLLALARVKRPDFSPLPYIFYVLALLAYYIHFMPFAPMFLYRYIDGDDYT